MGDEEREGGAYDEECINELHEDALGLEFLAEGLGPGRQETLGAGVGRKHRRRYGCRERSNVEDQTLLAEKRDAAG